MKLKPTKDVNKGGGIERAAFRRLLTKALAYGIISSGQARNLNQLLAEHVKAAAKRAGGVGRK